MTGKFTDGFSFIIKTIILFGFLYEYIPFFMPTTFLSSRKIAFVIVIAYFLAKGGGLLSYFKDRNLRRLFIFTIVCVFYIIFLQIVNDGSGELIINWYIFFFAYALLGPLLFAVFFNWNYERLLKSVAAVTLFQAIWCILTFYIYDFRILNSSLFIIEDNANIDFFSMSRLRSIGAEGSCLSVEIALSSFSFCYFIIKGKNVIFNALSLLISLYATILAGTTGMLIFTISIPLTMLVLMKKSKMGVISSLTLFMLLLFLYQNNSILFDSYQYENLTYKYVGLFQERGSSETVRVLLQDQKVSGISPQTIMGTGFSRGRLTNGIICLHDGGYLRNYFGVGLIMAVIFYYILYKTMYKLSKKTDNSIRYLLWAYIFILVVVEYKEPFVFYYFPFFIFVVLCYSEIETRKSLLKK